MDFLYAYTAVSVCSLAMCARNMAKDFDGAPTALEGFAIFCTSKLNIVVLMNMVYNLMYISGRLIQQQCFGELSDAELKSIRERTLNYLLFKIVFMGAILNADVHELLVWTTWFGTMCFLRVFIIICKERFRAIPESSTNAGRFYVLHISTIFSVCVANTILALLCWNLFGEAGVSVLFLLLFENVVIFVDCLQVAVKYSIHLGCFLTPPRNLNECSVHMHYIEFVAECTTQVITLAHFVHVWTVYGVSFTLIDLFLFMNMRSVFVDLMKRVATFKNYRSAMLEIQRSFPIATDLELKSNSKCAICLDNMAVAKKLPCGHLFHKHCLEQWIKFKRICPCCRASITKGRNTPARPPPGGPAGVSALPAPPPPPQPQYGLRRSRSILSFDSQNWGSWLPSITFDVFHTVRDHVGLTPSAGFRDQVSMVREMFPHIPQQTIVNELSQSPNIHGAIDSLLNS
ncbi:hypothetical protein AAMO2058_001670300 [Amorphochlora amoebiformis]|mmetsp:Transcript_279/g.386  ORF Transcript_279/g.386 Transcript_279/m.386 type:complete len:458 (-) Transcript_279:140-1513(-)